MQASQNKIRVGIIASSRLVREHLGKIIQRDMEMAFSLPETPLLHGDDSPNIILVDARDLDHSTVAALSKRDPTIKLIVIDADDDGLDLVACAQIRVGGFALKDSEAAAIAEAICVVNDNGTVIPAKIAQRLYQQLAAMDDKDVRTCNSDLTVRERQIVHLIGEGLTNKEIAQRLNIASHTAKTHVHNILHKTGCRRRVDLLSPAYSYRTVGERRRPPETADSSPRVYVSTRQQMETAAKRVSRQLRAR